jgi:hypothetical protein
MTIRPEIKMRSGIMELLYNEPDKEMIILSDKAIMPREIGMAKMIR